MQTTRVVLARHGRTPANVAHCFRGRGDPALDDEGHWQAERLARALEPMHAGALYSSPRARARATAEAIARATHLTMAVEEDLDDLDYGEWTGRTHDDVRAASPSAYATWMDAPHRARFPGGETLEDAQSRLWSTLTTVAARHPGELVVVVTHDAAVRVIVCSVLGAPLDAYHRIRIDNASTSALELEDGRATLLWLNATDHLARR